MKRFLLPLILLLTLCASARATTITISSYSAPQNWQYGTPAKLRIFVSSTFVDTDGVVHMAQQIGDPNFYQEISCSVTSGVVTIPSFTIASTVDSPTNPQSAYSFIWYDKNNTRRDTFAASFRVPVILGTTISWGALFTYNSTHPTPPGPQYPDVQQVMALINTASASGVPNSRTITATSPVLIDGGSSANLSANRTLSCPTCVVTSDVRLTDTRTPTDGSVTDAKIAGGGLSPSKIAGTAVITSDSRLNDTRTPTDNTVSTTKIQNLAVTNAKIANSAIDLTAKVTGVLPGANGGADVYDVKQSTFGAVGDGVTDDGPAIRAAIAANESAGGGGEVVIPGPGNYLFSTASSGALMTITKNVTLRCTGNATLLMPVAINNSTDFIHILPGSNYVMNKLRITGCHLQPLSGSPGRYGINIDVSTVNSQIREASIDYNIIGNQATFSASMLEFGSYGISVTNAGGLQDSFFTGTIERNWVGGGMNLINIGDQIHVLHNVVASLVPDRKSLIFSPLSGTAEHTIVSNSFTAGGGVQVLGGQTLQFLFNFIEMDNGSLTVTSTKMLDLAGTTNTIIKPRVVGNTFNAGANACDAIILDHVTQAKVADNNIAVPAGRYLWKGTANTVTNKYGDVYVGGAGNLTQDLGTNPSTEISLWQNDPPVTQAGGIAVTGRVIAGTGVSAGFGFGTNNPQMLAGSGSPNGSIAAATNSIWLRTDAAGVWINTSGGGSGTTWTQLTIP